MGVEKDIQWFWAPPKGQVVPFSRGHVYIPLSLPSHPPVLFLDALAVGGLGWRGGGVLRWSGSPLQAAIGARPTSGGTPSTGTSVHSSQPTQTALRLPFELLGLHFPILFFRKYLVKSSHCRLHQIFSGELISVIFPGKITPCCLVPPGKITQFITATNSQGIDWRNQSHLGYTR